MILQWTFDVQIHCRPPEEWHGIAWPVPMLFLNFEIFLSLEEYYHAPNNNNQKIMAEEERQKGHPRKRLRLDEAGNSVEQEEAPNVAAPKVTNIISLENDLQRELKSGITAYVNPDTTGFSGVFKQRYTDFLVNEVLPSGEVLHLVDIEDGTKRKNNGKNGAQAAEKLVRDGDPGNKARTGETPSDIVKETAPPTDTSATGKAVDQTVQDAPTELKSEEVIEVVIPPLAPEDEASLQEVYGEKTKKEIIRLWHAVLKHPKRKRKEFEKVYSPEIDDKDLRTKAHQIVRRIFSSKLDTTTLESTSIAITPALSHDNASKKEEWRARRQAGNEHSGGKLGWDELGGQYLHFTLYKENKDTMEVMSFLASRMKLHPRNFTFAGTKDRRGVTVQRISAYRVQSGRLAGLGRELRNAKIGGFKNEPGPLALGQLHGNEFLITLREAQFAGEEGLNAAERLELAKKIAITAANDLKTNGFINYYGLQRFGTFHVSTDEIGTKILQNDLKGAVELILSYSPEVLAAANGDKPELSVPSDDCKRAMALERWERTKSWQQVFETMPRKFSAESNIIKHLGYAKNGKRVNENDYQGAMMTLQRNMRLMYVHAYQSLVWNTVAGYRWNTHGNKVVEGDLVVVQALQVEHDDVDEAGEIIIQPATADRATVEDDYVRARALTKEEAESGKYTIWDVVLPLPGFDVVYPANDVGKYYEEFMGSEKGGELNPHDMRRKQKDYSLSGGYRKLLARPESLECEVKTYTADTEQLVKTDLERLMETNANEPLDHAMTDAPEDEISEQKLAVILKMQLGSSQYATMALRELLKAGGLKTYKADFTR
jgi:tRNA pseudouridine13 synthase